MLDGAKWIVSQMTAVAKSKGISTNITDYWKEAWFLVVSPAAAIESDAKESVEQQVEEMLVERTKDHQEELEQRMRDFELETKEAYLEQLKEDTEQWKRTFLAERPKEAQDREKIEYDEDIRWVYENLGNPHAMAQDAPGLGAWSMLCHAREDTRAFFSQLASKLMQKSQIEKEEEGKRDFEKRKFATDVNEARMYAEKSLEEYFEKSMSCPTCKRGLLVGKKKEPAV